MTTMTKVQDAIEMGAYIPTAVDAQKATADFRLISVGPYVIRWNDGRSECVTSRQLAKLQTSHSWATDF